MVNRSDDELMAGVYVNGISVTPQARVDVFAKTDSLNGGPFGSIERMPLTRFGR
jgi:hypothetical protein